MVLRRNLVFLEHKTGLNQFTMTDNELKWKFWYIAFTALVSFRATSEQKFLINVDDVRKHELLLLESRNHPKNGGRGHRKKAILEDRGGSDRIRHPEV